MSLNRPTYQEITIPIELFHLILDNIDDRQTLRNICLSSSILLQEARRILYRSYNWGELDHRHWQFLTAIGENPQLASLIRYYRVEVDTIDLTLPILSLIGPVLQNMVNLKELSVGIHSRHIDTFPLDKCTFQLRRMRWMERDQYWMDQEDRLDKAASLFTQWLTTQNDLRHLDWLCRRQISVPTSACPNLVSLRGTQKAIYALLPGRNITILHGMSIVGHGRDDLLDYDLIFPEITRLRSLSVQNFFQFADYSTLIDRYLQSLEHLELYELYQLQDGASLTLPPNIKVLVFSLRPPARMQFKFTSIVENIDQFFERCRQLQRIDVADFDKKSNKVYYRRWIRSSLGTVQEELKPLSLEEVVRGSVESIKWAEDINIAVQEIKMESNSDSEWE